MVMTGIDLIDIGFSDITGYAPICTSVFGGPSVAVTPVLGVGSGGPVTSVSCPATTAVMGISGSVDSNETPVQMTLRCR
jgi:hypothetical protein